MGKIIEGKQPLPEIPKSVTQFDGELPDSSIKVSGKRDFEYTPKIEKQIGDSGKG